MDAECIKQEEDANKRALRRKRHECEVEQKRCWELKRSLADISAEVELLTQEVRRARHTCAPQQEIPKELSAEDRQRLSQLHTRRVAEIVFKQCAAVLKHVMSHRWAWPFNEPVEVDRYPDYLKVVKNPMDLGNVRRKVEFGQYPTPAEMLADVRLVFDNARTYNPPGSDVYVMASTLQGRFEEKWNQSVVPKLMEEEAACRNDEAAVRARLVEAVHREAADALQGDAERLKGHFEALENRIMEAKSMAAAACLPMTTAAKRQLLDQMSRLSTEQYEWAISIILARYPGAAQHVGEELNLDLSMADALTLRQLQNFCHVCLTSPEAPIIWPGLLVGSGVRAFKAPGKRQKAAASRQNSDVRLMGPPPPVLMIDGLPNGASGNLAAIRVHAPSPLGYLPAKESCSGPAVPAPVATVAAERMAALAANTDGLQEAAAVARAEASAAQSNPGAEASASQQGPASLNARLASNASNGEKLNHLGEQEQAAPLPAADTPAPLPG